MSACVIILYEHHDFIYFFTKLELTKPVMNVSTSPTNQNKPKRGPRPNRKYTHKLGHGLWLKGRATDIQGSKCRRINSLKRQEVEMNAMTVA